MSVSKPEKVAALMELQEGMLELAHRYVRFLPEWLRHDMAEFSMRVMDLRVVIQKEVETEQRLERDAEIRREACNVLAQRSKTYEALPIEIKAQISREVSE